ncbi:MAG: hypothetical protein IAG13_05680 [Deltaproteobacteria bacterium]|nr:hypothetical protein [Nannocystaceae bacterium]
MPAHKEAEITQSINLELQSWLSKSVMASVTLLEDRAKGQAFLDEAAVHRANAVQAIADLVAAAVDARLAAK